MIFPLFHFSGSPHQKIWKSKPSEGASTPMPSTEGWPTFAFGGKHDRLGWKHLIPPIAGAELGYQISKLGWKAITNPAMREVGTNIADRVYHTGVGVTSGTLDSAVVQPIAGGPIEAVKSGGRVTEHGAEAGFHVVRATAEATSAAGGSVFVDSPEIAREMVMGVTTPIRGAFRRVENMGRGVINFLSRTFTDGEGSLQLREARSSQLGKIVKARWGRFAGIVRDDLAPPLIRIGTEGFDLFARWGSRFWNSRGIKYIRDKVGTSGGTDSPFGDYVMRRLYGQETQPQPAEA